MADETEYTIPVTADVSGVVAGMEQMSEAASTTAEQIDAAFSASGAVIRDFADEATGATRSVEEYAAAMAEWREATGLAVEGNAALATSTAEVIAELDGTAAAAREAAAQVVAAEAEKAEAMEAAAAEQAEAAEAQQASFQASTQGALLLGRALLPLIGVTMGASAFKSAAESMMQFGDSIRTTAAELNVGEDQARGFNLAMSSLGAQSGQVATAIRRLAQDASNGGKNLARLGVSATDADGKTRPLIDVFEEVATKINNLADSNQRAEAATTLLGRSGLQLLGVLGQVPERISEYTSQQENNTAVNREAVEQSLALHKALTDLNAVWQNLIIAVAPAVVDGLKQIASYLKQSGDEAEAAVQKFNDFAAAAMNAVKAAVDFAAHLPLGEGEGSHGGPEAAYVDNSLGYSPDAAGHSAEDATELPAVTVQGSWAPPAKKGRGGGGGGKADPMAGLDESLDLSADKMAKLNNEFKELGDESKMAAKEGGESYAQLAAQATTDYQKMQEKYKEFTDAVNSGSKQAAQNADKEWHQAAEDFQKDWDRAKQKATQDMQQVKSTADQLASEVSSVLDNAISGKLNWKQEFDKVLEQMLNSLIKHLAQMVAMWAAHEAQVNAVKAAGNAAGLAAQKASNAAAGTSDAVTAAKGAYSSAAQIPYIGWIVAPAAAAAAFSGVEAFGSAEGGWDIPPGINPLVQAHENEMVLPANIAQNIRNFTGGASANINVTSNVNALDSRSVAQVIDASHVAIAKAAAKAHRSGHRFNLG